MSFQVGNQYNLKEKYALSLLSNILCNSYTSRLTSLLREKYGLVYGINAYTEFNEAGGSFTINTQFASESFIKKGISVLPLIIKELNLLIKKGITKEELDLCKHNIQGHLLLELENIENQSLYNGIECVIFQEPTKIIPYSKLYDTCYKSITKEEIHLLIQKYFCLSRMCIAIVGNHIPPLSTVSRECNKLINK
jgi:predicted Zn-dependent peptidase